MASGMLVFDGIGPVLDYMMLTTADRVADAMIQGAQDMQVYAQSNAPWSDITGAARNGLNAQVDMGLGEVSIVLAHSVDYGIWLELIQNGAFAIILPTIEALGPEILRRAGGEVVNSGGF